MYHCALCHLKEQKSDILNYIMVINNFKHMCSIGERRLNKESELYNLRFFIISGIIEN